MTKTTIPPSYERAAKQLKEMAKSVAKDGVVTEDATESAEVESARPVLARAVNIAGRFDQFGKDRDFMNATSAQLDTLERTIDHAAHGLAANKHFNTPLTELQADFDKFEQSTRGKK